MILITTIAVSPILLSHMGCSGNGGDPPPDEMAPEVVEWTCSSTPTSSILTADAPTGWMERCDNIYYVQGPWYEDADSESTITADWSGADGGEFCAQGSLGEVTDPGTQWGAAITFYLCHTDGDETPASEAFTVSTCPWNGILADMDLFSGMTATIDGNISPGNELRVVFQEAGRDENTYIVSSLSGSLAHFDFNDAVSPDGNPIDIDHIEAIVFQATASDADIGSFDFCVSNISFY